MNTIDLIKGQLGASTVSLISKQMNESEAGVQKAINVLVPIVLGGMAENSENEMLLYEIQTVDYRGFLEGIMKNADARGLSEKLARVLFWGREGDVNNALASYAGLNNISAYQLLLEIISVSIAVIGRLAVDNHLDKDGISKLLEEQKELVSPLIPSNFHVEFLGYNGGEKQSELVKEPQIVQNRKKKKDWGTILKWIIPLLLVFAAVFFLLKNFNKTMVETTITPEKGGKQYHDTVIVK